MLITADSPRSFKPFMVARPARSSQEVLNFEDSDNRKLAIPRDLSFFAEEVCCIAFLNLLLTISLPSTEVDIID